MKLRIVASVIVLLMGARLSFADTPSTQPSASSEAAVVVLKGEIDNYSRDTLFRRFDEARAIGAKTVILQIDTYGGLVSAALEISHFLKQQTDLHTVAFIQNKAYSAGAMIALACDEIVMQPQSVIGDCAPIMYRSDGTLDSLAPTERAKAESPILADFRDSAQRNGYDPLLAESMVSVDRVVHYVQSKSGERKFVNDADYTKLIGDAWKPVDGVPNPVDDGKELLTVHSELAQKLGLSKGQFATPEALASSRAWRIIETFAPNAGEAVIQFLNAGWVRMVLIVLFIITVKISFSAPGHGVAEATALITLGLIVGIPLLTGYAQWWEIALIFVGLSLLAFEIFVFPGHLVSGAIGLLMMIGGLVMTFVPREPSHPGILPQMSGTWISMQRGLLFVTCGMLCSLLLWLWLQRYLPKIPYFSRLVLTSSGGALQPAVNDRAELWPTVGAIGRAVSELKPGGNASFPDPATGESRIAPVISDSGFVAPNTQIVVREVAGNRVVVRPA